MPQRLTVGAYYFPNYHPDPRNAEAHGPGWTEWELLQAARPRFPGHAQPKVPLWGYEDEADPAVMARKIDAAADHGLNHFIFDWYYYEDGPFLERCLEEGFLRAPNRDRLEFALMWANHDWVNIMPARRGGPNPLQYAGAVSRKGFDAAVERIISRYFSQPNYWKIDGRPYFSFYELMTLVRGLAGIEEARAALDDFRARTRAAGFPDLHLNAVVWGIQILPSETRVKNPRELLAALGFDSVSSYVWIHHVPLEAFPATPYETTAAAAICEWDQLAASFMQPYFPNVTMGWDASPRTIQTDAFTNAGYPWMATLSDNTPERFRAALAQAKAWLERRPDDRPRTLSINAWNEWTEGSYLEPDTVNGLGYLEAIRDVFGSPTARA